MILHISNKENKVIRSCSLIQKTEENLQNPFQQFQITSNDLEQANGILILRFEIPIINIQGFWMPSMQRP